MEPERPPDQARRSAGSSIQFRARSAASLARAGRMRMRSIVEHSSCRLPIAGPSLPSPARLLRFHESRPGHARVARQSMSRFPTVHSTVAHAVVAGRIGCTVYLVTSRLAGCYWWNDCEHDRHQLLDAWADVTWRPPTLCPCAALPPSDRHGRPQLARGLPDRLGQAARADQVAEVVGAVAGEHGVLDRPGSGRALQAEQRPELTEVAARAEHS